MTAEAHYRLGLEIYVKGDVGGAIAEYREALRLKPYDEGAKLMLKFALDDKDRKGR